MTQSSQRFCLRWNNHQSNLLSVFDQLLQDESFVDVTLAVEGQFLRAHKMVLSACSPYFQTLFVGHPDKHPIVILKDVPFADMRSLLDFMYRGEVSVDQDRLSAFLKVAESLRIKGLTEVNEDKCDTQSSLSSLISNPPSSSSAPPPPDLHRIQLSQPSHKRSSTPSSVNGATSPYSQKRKRGRPRKLSESSDGGDESPDRDCAILDSDSKQLDSSYGNGPPDLLEVNMSDHPLNTSGALSDDGNESPERVISQEQETEDFCYINNIKREIDEPSSPDNKNSSRENNVGIKSEISNHQSSERCPADKCHWKEILKRLKKPDLSVQVEQRAARNAIDAKTESDSAAVNADEDVPSIPDNNNVVERRDYSLPEHSLFSVYDRNGNSKNNAEYFLGDIHRTFYSDVVTTASNRDGGNGMMVVEEMDEYGAVAEDEDEDDAMTKYEYDSFRSMIYDQSENGTGTGSLFSHANAANVALGSNTAVEPQKIPDKSSVRQFCVQIGEHLFQCTFCSKTYTHISNFSRHFLSAHHGLRQEVPCPVCCRIFTRRDNMLTHMKQVHRITVARGSPLNVVKKYSDQNANVPPPPSSLTSTSNSF